MDIERIELRHISQELVSPFVTSFGPQQTRDCLLLTVYAEGLVGWGECVATNDPGYSYETTGTAWHILEEFLIPAVVGKEVSEPEALPGMLSFVRGHPLAKAGLEQAIWDLAAQRAGVSMAALLAAPYAEGPRERVPVGVSIGIQPSIDDTLRVIGEYVDAGYRRIKLKIKPGHDVALATAAREAFPDLPIMLDANSAYRLSDAAVFQAMDDLDLLMLEQPLGYEDIYDHSQLRPLIKTPLCLDESIHSADDARFAQAIGACDIINVKPARVSGWTEARAIHDLCLAAGIGLWVGGMLETGIGRAGQLALAALPGFTLPGDISATARYYVPDIAAPFTLNSEDSTMTVPTGPGLGITLDETELARVTLRTAAFVA